MAEPPTSRTSTRRRVLGAVARAAAALALAPPAWTASLRAQPRCVEPPPGDVVRVLPLYGAGAQDAPLGRLVGGRGLDARQFTDLSILSADRLVTPAAEVFVRTAAPSSWSFAPESWSIRLPIGGTRAGVTAQALAEASQPMGVHLIECAGNSNPQHFGLMSAVDWRGVPLLDVLARRDRPAGAWGVRVTGRDDVDSPTRSVPGASWILPIADLETLAPFLATHLDGAPLTAHHGAPVRLVVPGWYGCAWIKWVDAIDWVDRDEPATSQMIEFATRTHQDGRPALARDYEAPVIDTAAMPIRVEQVRVAGRLECRIIGLVWGGSRPVDRLVLRTGPRDPGRVVELCPAPPSSRTWSLWTARWTPDAPGLYDLTLKVADAAVRTRRLDLSFYIRRVRVDEI